MTLHDHTPPPVSISNTKERDVGLDAFRVLAAVMITMVHTTDMFTGCLDSPNILTSAAGWMFLSISNCGVNCFALLSGYLMIRSRIRFSRLFELWLTCLFYGATGILVFACMNPAGFSMTAARWFSLFFPITTGSWWYMTAYFWMYLFIPIVNTAMQRFNRKENTILVACLPGGITLFSSLCCLLHLTSADIRFISGRLLEGYTAIWLLVCYIVGGYIRLYQHDLIARFPRRKTIRLYAWCMGIWLLVSLTAKYAPAPRSILGSYQGAFSEWIRLLFEFCNRVLFSYTSPLNTGSAVLLLLVFMQLKIRSSFWKRWLPVLSAASLGVYLFQCQPDVFGYLRAEPHFGMTTPGQRLLLFPVLTLALVVIGLAVDRVRGRIFRNLHVPERCEALSARLSTLGATGYRRFFRETPDA